ncbi:hypothetical protein OUZ56_016612 [Daphnia magna]|uniref:Uncharacterized protein n=1 Tax=Daphnia magna TaxID=35525 RepID=A0ABR0AR17_9CRUS|nr:hypothetical protein OUZ56_016612 [Daphnia magna]
MAPIKRPKRYGRYGAEPGGEACNIPRSTFNGWLRTTGEPSQIVETPSLARAAEIEADNNRNIDEDNRDHLPLHHPYIMNSDNELDTTRQCVVVAGDEKAHSPQQSTPSPTVTDDEPIHPSLVLGKGELLSLILAFYIRFKLSKSCLDSLLHKPTQEQHRGTAAKSKTTKDETADSQIGANLCVSVVTPTTYVGVTTDIHQTTNTEKARRRRRRPLKPRIPTIVDVRHLGPHRTPARRNPAP